MFYCINKNPQIHSDFKKRAHKWEKRKLFLIVNCQLMNVEEVIGKLHWAITIVSINSGIKKQMNTKTSG